MDPTRAQKNAPIIQEVKAIRVEIDKLAQMASAKYNSDASREAVKHLKNAKHWFGEYLAELGLELPAEYADKSL